MEPQVKTSHTQDKMCKKYVVFFFVYFSSQKLATAPYPFTQTIIDCENQIEAAPTTF